VLDAASRLFAEHGWAATTVATIAGEAGTSIETVYAGFGSKPALLSAAIDAALVGDDRPTPMLDRHEFATLGAGSRLKRLETAAHLVAVIHARSVPLLRALQEAACSDETAASRWQRYEHDRHVVIAAGLERVAGHDVAPRVVDAVWAVAGPELFAKLVLDRGWAISDYEEWLAGTCRALLAEKAP
jgi:AcrR family transcriptional regulator